MRACTSPGWMVRSTPFRMGSPPATRTCRSSISNSGGGFATRNSLEKAGPYSHYRRSGNYAPLGGRLGVGGFLLGLLGGAFLELLLGLPEAARELRQLGP